MKRILSLFYMYLSIVGMFGFCCFIMEESIQMLSFSMFTVKDTQRWDIGIKNINRMEKINNHLGVINGVFMWLQPIQMFAYKDFVEATRGYIESQRGLLLANAPELHIGHTIGLDFYYRSIRETGEGYELRSGKLMVLVSEIPEANPIRITGRIYKKSEGLYGFLLQEI
jgi:hypothetical protein